MFLSGITIQAIVIIFLLFIVIVITVSIPIYWMIKKYTQNKSKTYIMSFLFGTIFILLFLYIHYQVTGKGILE
jgi:hypothetical protein